MLKILLIFLIVFFTFYNKNTESQSTINENISESVDEEIVEEIKIIEEIESEVLDNSNVVVDNVLSKPAFAYYYDTLAPIRQETYDVIYNGIINYEKEIEFSYESEDTLLYVLDKVVKDHPELFWVKNNALFVSNDSTTILKLSYPIKPEDFNDVQNEIMIEVNNLLSQIPLNSRDYDKVKYVYEWLIKNVQYKSMAPDVDTIKGAFVNKQATEIGFSAAFQLIMDQLEIPCITVGGASIIKYGDPTCPYDHTWNMIELDGSYYHVDTLFGNPAFWYEDPESIGIVYELFCVTDEEIMNFHEIDYFNLPECNDSKYSYYKQNGSYFDSHEKERMQEVAIAALKNGENVVYYKFADSNLYEEILESCDKNNGFINSTLFYVNVTEGFDVNNCYIYCNDVLNSIIIVWYEE